MTDMQMPVDYLPVSGQSASPIKTQAVIMRHNHSALVRASDLDAVPSQGDVLIEPDGTEWLVDMVSGKPGAYWDLGLRVRPPSARPQSSSGSMSHDR